MKDNNLINTLKQIAQLSKSIEIDLDQKGHLRSLTTTSQGGLQHLFCPSKSTNHLKTKVIDEIDAFYIADEFINLPAIQNDLQSANIELEMGDIIPFAFGYRISFKQMATCQNKKMVLPVCGGAMHLGMNKVGEIFSLTSTLQYEQIQSEQKAVMSKDEAVQIVCSNCMWADKSRPHATDANLMLVSHNDKLQLAYEVTIVCHRPDKSYTCFVLASTGKIIARRDRIQQYRQFGIRNTGGCGQLKLPLQAARGLRISALVKARTLLKTPDPNQPISQQMSEVIVEDLPNPQVLRNAYLDMFTGKNMNMVYAKADGSYCYGPSHVQFAAVSVFLSLKSQIELYLQSGMLPPERALTVIVDDASVKDNAYFDPLQYEIHLGVGTGPEHGGLTRHIAFDLGVANHEFGHVIAYWQNVAHELAGLQGAAINEAIGDVLGALVMDYLFRIWYTKQIGRKLTKRDLKDDARVIGRYALPPFGIRTQKNSRCMPGDLTGEPHADGLIIGGALADCLIAMATQPGKSIEEQIRLFVKMNLMAVALLPGYKVMFTDMLRALITADQQICAGQYRSLIERCFRKHGITFDTVADNEPSILPLLS